MFFGNATTMYVSDEGSGNATDVASHAGLEKWSLVAGTWQLDYVLTQGLIGEVDTGLTGADGSWPKVTTVGLRNLTGVVNGNQVTLWATTSTSSRKRDAGVGQEPEAERYLARRIKTAAAARDARVIETGSGGAILVRTFADKWLKERRALGVRSIADDESRMKRHILPELGDLALDEVQSRHIRELVLKLRTKTLRKDEKLAPRTVRNIYGLLSTMFRDAVADGLVATTPCVLRRGVLPKKADKDPAWRPTAIYTREESERLISDRRIPEDRRVLYALKGLAGLRHGEAASLRWRQYDRTLEPLSGLSLEHTKTDVPRRVPVHPTLARVLAEWKLAGWERTYGRAPAEGDLIVPTRNGTERTSQEAPKALRLDLETLELRDRRGHDLRRTFITLAQVDGARRDLLETITHEPRGDIVSLYTTFPWAELCAEVAKLKIELREGAIIEVPTVPMPATRYTAVTGAERARRRWKFPVTPSGIESVPTDAKQHENSPSPTENRSKAAVRNRVAKLDCSKVAKLAKIAANAVRNCDLGRAIEVLEELESLAEGRQVGSKIHCLMKPRRASTI